MQITKLIERLEQYQEKHGDDADIIAIVLYPGQTRGRNLMHDDDLHILWRYIGGEVKDAPGEKEGK